MRIALVQSSWTPHSEARVRAVRASLIAQGHSLDVITVAARQSDYRWPAPGDDKTMLFPNKDYWDIGYRELRGRLTLALEGSGPDVVVLPGWAFKESQSGLGWAIRNDTARVLVTDSQEIDRDRRFPAESFKRLFLPTFGAALVGGSPHIAYLAQLGFERSACFPGCDVVDNDFFATGSRSVAEDTPTLLSCTRLLPRKNVAGMLAALANVDGWSWRVAGDGPERPAIERHIAELGLGDRVELLGHVDYKDLPKLYASADVYIQPSLSEPWGMAVNEAMAAGLPVLVSDRCGCREDLVDEPTNGFCFDPTERSSIEGALTKMLALRVHWAEMGRISSQIVSRWGLDLYATNLLRACINAEPVGRSSLMTRALGRVL